MQRHRLRNRGSFTHTHTHTHLHNGESGVVAGHSGEMVLQHGQGAGQGHMATPAEQSHPREAEDGGYQGSVGHSAQTLDAALKAAC